MRYSEVKEMLNEIGRFALDEWDCERWKVAKFLVDDGQDPGDVTKCVNDGEYIVYEDIEEYIDETLSSYGIEIPQWIVVDYDKSIESVIEDPSYYLYELDDGRILDAYGL